MRVSAQTWMGSRRGFAGAICAAFMILSTASLGQVSNEQTLAIRANTASLCALVGKQQVILFNYMYDPVDAEPREIEPYAVGYTRKHEVLLFGRQVKGYSKSAETGAGDLPGWRNFRVDRIKGRVVNATASTFEPVRSVSSDHRFISELACKNDWFQ